MKKLDLKTLKVSSFATTRIEAKAQTIKGGAPPFSYYTNCYLCSEEYACNTWEEWCNTV